MRREQKSPSDGVKHILLGLRVGEIGVQKVLFVRLSGLHQVFNPIGSDRLHNVRTDGLQLHGRVPPVGSRIGKGLLNYCAMRLKLA